MGKHFGVPVPKVWLPAISIGMTLSHRQGGWRDLLLDDSGAHAYLLSDDICAPVSGGRACNLMHTNTHILIVIQLTCADRKCNDLS